MEITDSDGTPVKASDFIRAFERAVHIPWGGAGAFMTPIVEGATAYSTGKAKTLGARSLGHVDPGSITLSLVLEAWAEARPR